MKGKWKGATLTKQGFDGCSTTRSGSFSGRFL